MSMITPINSDGDLQYFVMVESDVGGYKIPNGDSYILTYSKSQQRSLGTRKADVRPDFFKYAGASGAVVLDQTVILQPSEYENGWSSWMTREISNSPRIFALIMVGLMNIFFTAASIFTIYKYSLFLLNPERMMTATMWDHIFFFFWWSLWLTAGYFVYTFLHRKICKNLDSYLGRASLNTNTIVAVEGSNNNLKISTNQDDDHPASQAAAIVESSKSNGAVSSVWEFFSVNMIYGSKAIVQALFYVFLVIHILILLTALYNVFSIFTDPFTMNALASSNLLSPAYSWFVNNWGDVDLATAGLGRQPLVNNVYYP